MPGVATRLKKRLPPESDGCPFEPAERSKLLRRCFRTRSGGGGSGESRPRGASQCIGSRSSGGDCERSEILGVPPGTAEDAWRKFPADDYARRVLARNHLSDAEVDVPTASSAAALQHGFGTASQDGRGDGLESTGFVNGISGCRELDLVDTVDRLPGDSGGPLATPLAGKRQRRPRSKCRQLLGRHIDDCRRVRSLQVLG